MSLVTGLDPLLHFLFLGHTDPTPGGRGVNLRFSDSSRPPWTGEVSHLLEVLPLVVPPLLFVLLNIGVERGTF